MAGGPMVDEEQWRELGEDPRPLNPRRQAMARARNRRWAVVVCAASLGLFLFGLMLFRIEIYSDGTPCGNALSSTGLSEWCEDRTQIFAAWAVLLLVASIGLALWAFRLRWGRDWTAERLADADAG